MDNLSILLKSKISDDISDLNKSIIELSKNPNLQRLSLKINIDDTEIKLISDQIKQFQNQMSKSLNLKVNTTGGSSDLDKLSITMNTTNKELAFIEKRVRETTNAQGQLVKETSKYKQEVNEAGDAQTVLAKRTEQVTDNFKKQRQEQQKLLDDFNKKNINGIDYQIKQRELEGQQFSNLLKSQMQKEQELTIEKQKTAEIQKQIDLYKLKMLGGNGVKGELDIFSEKQKGKYDKNALTKIRTDVEALNVSTPDLNNKIKQTGIEFSSLKQQAAQSGSVMSRALENAFKFLRFYLVGGVLVGVVGAFRSGVKAVVELDTALTELNKVADLTDAQLKNITTRSYEAGVVLGRTGKEVINATAEWVRAGYNIEEAFELSQQSLLLTNIGDGITDVKEASSSLIAVLKGFKMEAKDTAHVVDALNEVSNNYAVDTNNLTEILKRTSGTLGQTGTSYEQLIGLATGGFESLRNAEMVASGINMISQRKTFNSNAKLLEVASYA